MRKQYFLGWLYTVYASALVIFSYFYLVFGILGSLHITPPQDTGYAVLFLVGCTLPIYLWFYPARKIGVFEKGIKMMREAVERSSPSVSKIKTKENCNENKDGDNVDY